MVQFSLVSTTVRDQLALQSLPGRRLAGYHSCTRDSKTGLFPTNIRVPVPVSCVHIHSMTVKVEYDHFSNFESGNLFVVAWPKVRAEEEAKYCLCGQQYIKPKNFQLVPTIQSLSSKYGGQVVAEAPPLKSSSGAFETTTMTFFPQQGFVYNIWALARSYFIYEVTLHTMVYDTPNQVLSKNYQTLEKLEHISFVQAAIYSEICDLQEKEDAYDGDSDDFIERIVNVQKLLSQSLLSSVSTMQQLQEFQSNEASLAHENQFQLLQESLSKTFQDHGISLTPDSLLFLRDILEHELEELKEEHTDYRLAHDLATPVDDDDVLALFRQDENRRSRGRRLFRCLARAFLLR